MICGHGPPPVLDVSDWFDIVLVPLEVRATVVSNLPKGSDQFLMDAVDDAAIEHARISWDKDFAGGSWCIDMGRGLKTCTVRIDDDLVVAADSGGDKGNFAKRCIRNEIEDAKERWLKPEA